jgi:uncharacterized protein (TIRG00374 family)
MTRKRAIQTIVGLALMGGLIYWADPARMARLFAGADYGFLLLSLVLATVDRILMPLKWNLLLRAKGLVVPWRQAVKVYYISSAMGVFLPPTVGADMARYYLLSRDGCPKAEVVASILVERVLGMIALLLFGIMGGALFLASVVSRGTETPVLTVVLTALAVTAVVAAAFAASMSERTGMIAQRLLRRLEGGRLAGLAGKLESLLQAYQGYQGRRRALGVFLLLSLLENLLPVIRTYAVVLAFGAAVPLIYMFMFIPIVQMLIRLPISFDGFGVQEGALVYFFGLLGVGKAAALSIGLANHMLFLVSLLPGAVLYLALGERARMPGAPRDATMKEE